MPKINKPPPKGLLPSILKKPPLEDGQSQTKVTQHPKSAETFETKSPTRDPSSMPLVLIPSEDPTIDKNPINMDETELQGLLESFVAAVAKSQEGSQTPRKTLATSTLLGEMLSELKTIANDFRSYVDNPTQNFKKPYKSTAQAKVVECLLKTFFVPAMAIRFGKEDASIWQAFLNRQPGDSLEPRIFDDPSSRLVKSFRKWADDESTRAPNWCLRGLKYINHLHLPANEWVSFSWEDMESKVPFWRAAEEDLIGMDFSKRNSISGNLAGGVGSSPAGPDERCVSGGFQVRLNVDAHGEILSIDISTKLNFVIRDSVDFDPGGRGKVIERYLTTPLSRLESSDMAFAMPYEVHFEGTEISKTYGKDEILSNWPTFFSDIGVEDE